MHCAAMAVTVEMNMLSAEFGWFVKPQKGFWLRNINASHYFACTSVALNVKVKYLITVRICNKHWKTKPKVHAKDIKLVFLLTPPSWIAALNHLQNGLDSFIKPVSDSSNRLL